MERAPAPSGAGARARRRCGASSALRSAAAILPRSSPVWKLTFWPSLSPPSPARSTAEMWTKTSALPSSGWMKPKPLVELNHLTVPVLMEVLSKGNEQPGRQERRRCLQSVCRLMFEEGLTWRRAEKSQGRPTTVDLGEAAVKFVV